MSRRQLLITNQKGLGLLGVMVAIGLLATAGAGMMALMDYQYSENREYTRKLDRDEIKSFLIANFGDGTVCDYMFKTMYPLQFNKSASSATVTVSGPPIEMIPSGIPVSGQSPVPYVRVGTDIFTGGTVDSGFRAESISLNNIQEVGQNQYAAELTVNLSQSTQRSRSIRPPSVRLVFNTDAAGAINNCSIVVPQLRDDACKPGWVVASIKNGQIQCIELPVGEPKTECLGATVSWVQSGLTCAGELQAAKDSAHGTATSSIGGRGTAEFVCSAGSWVGPLVGAVCRPPPTVTPVTMGCTVLHPIGYNGCAEFYLASGGNPIISMMTEGQVINVNWTYGGSGSGTYKCVSGSMTTVSQNCITTPAGSRPRVTP